MSSVPPSEPFEVAVKASLTTPNKIGDCKNSYPFIGFSYFQCLACFFLHCLIEIEMKLAFETLIVLVERIG